MELTALERAVLREIGSQLSDQDRAALEAQIAIAEVRLQENTGVGFFTYFNLRQRPASIIQADTKGCYVGARFDALGGRLGFILWTENGCLNYLEGYAEDIQTTVGFDLSALTFELVTSA